MSILDKKRRYIITNNDLGLITIALNRYIRTSGNPILIKELRQVKKRLIEQ